MTTLTRSATFPALSLTRFGQAPALVFKALERARQRRQLAKLDAQALHDIGISRDQALAEALLPFWKA